MCKLKRTYGKKIGKKHKYVNIQHPITNVTCESTSYGRVNDIPKRFQ